MHKSLEENTNKHCDQQCGENTERNRLCGWGSPTQCAGNRHTTYTPNVSSELILDLTAASATDTVRRHLVTRRNMECFQGLAILVVVCTVITVIICALQTLCFFLLKRTKNVPLSRINEDLNGHNREPGNPREINIQPGPHLNRRKQPIEHSEQPFNQVGFMIIA